MFVVDQLISACVGPQILMNSYATVIAWVGSIVYSDNSMNIIIYNMNVLFGIACFSRFSVADICAELAALKVANTLLHLKEQHASSEVRLMSLCIAHTAWLV